MQLGCRVIYVDTAQRWLLSGDCDEMRAVTEVDLNLSPDQTIVMCDFPYSPYFLTIFQKYIDIGCISICRIVDHWSSLNLQPDFSAELEPVFLRLANRVYASSPLNAERLSDIRPDIAVLPNGVDLEHFRSWRKPEAPILARGRINLGVVASFWFNHWINMEPLIRYAQDHPEDTIYIVGRAQPFVDRTTSPNIVLVGAKPWKSVADYIHQFDVCVIPYSVDETRYTNPIKALEYLACCKPVVSPPNPSLVDYPHIHFYEGADEFEQTVLTASSDEVDCKKLWKFLENHTWKKRIEKILQD